MGPVIRDAGGFIDKYIGDAIMALFPRSADDGLAAAVAMQRKIPEYNEHRRSSGYPPIGIGVGVHTGSLMLGTVGEQERMDGSVIADAVNLCSRLEALTRVYGAGILTTGRTIKALASPGSFAARFIDKVRVKGRSETVLLFEVLDGDPPAVRDLKLSYKEELARSMRLYYGKKFAEALRILEQLRSRNPQDEVVRIFRNRAELYSNLGAPDDWQGVELIEVK
jgi:two-component system sensor histidine kinase ChiS